MLNKVARAGIFVFFFLAMQCCLWYLSSLTSDQTWATVNESVESYLLDHQGIPLGILVFHLILEKILPVLSSIS